MPNSRGSTGFDYIPANLITAVVMEESLVRPGVIDNYVKSNAALARMFPNILSYSTVKRPLGN